eukprot:5654947-Amphidinium_carterae.1
MSLDGNVSTSTTAMTQHKQCFSINHYGWFRVLFRHALATYSCCGCARCLPIELPYLLQIQPSRQSLDIATVSCNQGIASPSDQPESGLGRTPVQRHKECVHVASFAF